MGIVTVTSHGESSSQISERLGTSDLFPHGGDGGMHG